VVRQPSCFLSVMWCEEAFPGLGAQGVDVFDSPCCFISSKCGFSISARFCSLGAYVVCFCALVAILDPQLLIFVNLFLYPVSLLELFMVSGRFLVDFFGSFRYKIMLSSNRDILTSSFHICISFFSSCLIALAKKSKTMFNKSGESGHSSLIPDLKEMVSVFPHLV
jgi:hypothetical protein